MVVFIVYPCSKTAVPVFTIMHLVLVLCVANPCECNVRSSFGFDLASSTTKSTCTAGKPKPKASTQVVDRYNKLLFILLSVRACVRACVR